MTPINAIDSLTAIKANTMIVDTLSSVSNQISLAVTPVETIKTTTDSITSSVVKDTLSAVQNINPSEVESVLSEAIEGVSNSGGSSNVGAAIAFIGLLIFAAHLFTEIFSRKRIPDVLLLMIIGLIIGPIFNWIRPEQLGSVGKVFSQITLVILLFQSGTELSFSSLKDSIRGTMVLTIANFLITFLIIGLIGWLALGMNASLSFMLGAILGGTSSAVVIPMVKQINIGKKSATILILESAFSDVLCIVFALAILESFRMGKLEYGILFGQIFSSFVLATIIGLVGAIFWSLMLEKVRHIKNSILTTPAFVFIIFGVNEILGYSGAIAALAFGFGLANSDGIYKSILKKFYPSKPSTLNDTEKLLFSELVFLMKTFFFVFIGISIQLTDFTSILIGLLITILIFIIRIPTVNYSFMRNDNDITNNDKQYMSAIVPKGLAAAVLATMVNQTNVPGAERITNIVYSVILFSIIFTSVLIPLLEKTKSIGKFYTWSFNLLTPKNMKKLSTTEIVETANTNDETSQVEN